MDIIAVVIALLFLLWISIEPVIDWNDMDRNDEQ